MNICVYCSASPTIDPAYFETARALGEVIARRGDTLVYGGASVGLMGEVARTVQAGGARVIGVIPQALVDREIAWPHADELVVVDTMRERKRIMEARADAFVALPGGIGTLDEVFEIMNLRQLRLTTSPLILLNQAGFYEPVRALLQAMQQASFLRAELHELVQFAPDVAHIFGILDAARPG